MQNRFSYESGFAPVPYLPLRDTSISIGARGMLAMMMTHSADWEFRRKDLIEKCACGPDKYDSMRRELIEAGYLRIEKVRDEGGRIRGHIWHLYPHKKPQEKQSDDDRNTEKPESGSNQNTVQPESGSTRIRKTPKLKEKQDKGDTKKRITKDKSSAKPKSEKPPVPDEPDWESANPKDGTFAIMEKGVKYPLPDVFYPGTEMKDYGLIDCRFAGREYQNIVGEWVDYWRDQGNTKKGKKTAVGWKRALKSWLDRKAVDYKTRFRDPPFDHRKKGQVEESGDIDLESLPVEFWISAVRHFADQDEWRGYGPKPGEPGCIAPTEVLQKFGFAIDQKSD